MENKKIAKKRNILVRTFSIIAILIVVVLAAVFIALNWYNDAIYNGGSRSEEIDFRVEVGSSLVGIADSLEAQGIIKSSNALKIYLRLNSLSPNIKVGEYRLTPDLNIPELIEIFEKGVFKPSVAITVKEGLWNEDIAEIFTSALSDGGSDKKFVSSEFLAIVNNPDDYQFSSEVSTFLEKAKPAGKPLTGYLFPDTYRVNSDADAMEVVETMVLNLQRRLGDNQIDPENVSINQDRLSDFYEALVLASILEREAGRDDPINIVSGVFHNRLRDGMLLQSDATVNFATGKNLRGATFEDLKVDSPYNTYKYIGLPPTPINNPGVRSIKAAINPEETEFYYFWHASRDNKIYFGRTLAEHEANIRNYP